MEFSRLQRCQRDYKRLLKTVSDPDGVDKLIHRLSELEQENAQLQARLATEKHRAYEQGQNEGWSYAASLVNTLYEPLVDIWIDIEHLIGEVESMASMGLNDKMKPIIEKMAEELASYLAKGDIPNAKLGAIHNVPYFVDFSGAHAFYEAMKAFATTKNKGQELTSLANRKIRAERMNSLSALNRRKPRGRDLHATDIATKIGEILAAHPRLSVEQAAEDALQELDLEYDVRTAVSYYYRVRNDKSITPISS